MNCIIINRTRIGVIVKEDMCGVTRKLGHIAGGEKFQVRLEFYSTYREYVLIVGVITAVLSLSSDDMIDWSEISIQEGPDGALRWVGTKIRQIERLRKFEKAVSLKFDGALRSCNYLEKLCGRAKICRHQCKHLFQTYKEGIQNMAQIYSALIQDDQIVMNYRFNDTFMKTGKSLDSLEYIVCDAKDLLGSCATNLGMVALIVSSQRPPVEKDMEVHSDFDLLIHELQWHLDVMEYLIQPSGHAKLDWSPTMCRYVLKRSNESENVVPQVKAPDQGKQHSFACVDREELQSRLEDGSIYNPNTNYRWCKRQWFGLGKKNLNGTILKRCKPGQDPQSRPMDLEAFKINHLDLHPCTDRQLGEGTFKTVYEGNWYGQLVAIATIRMDDSDDPDTSPTPFEIFRDEVNGLLQLQHPKVVSLFGWAETTDAPPPIKKRGDEHRVHGGYIVTEKMESTLHQLIVMRKRDMSRNESGPFSYSVGIDILLQIVLAMLHVHNHGIMHRDLKPGNFLVNPRSSPSRPGVDTYYNVKLIDFGLAKLYVGDDGNTYNRGTTAYGVPEMMKGCEREADHGKYGPSVDVFSFAMTCYQVITGRKPFQGTDAARAIRNKERPVFPLTVLQALRELTEECWNENPEERPSFKEIQKRLWTIKMKLAVE